MDDHAYAGSPSKKQKTADLVEGKPAHSVNKGPFARILQSSTVAIPLSSLTVEELRQRLREAQIEIQRANRETRAAQERAEFTKKYYDSLTKKAETQFITKDKKREKEWERKLTEGTLSEASARIDELTRENDALKKRLQEADKLNIGLHREIAAHRKEMNQEQNELTRENNALKIRLKGAEKLASDTCKVNIDLHRHIAAHKHETIEVLKKANDKMRANVELVNVIGQLRAKLAREEKLRTEDEKRAVEDQRNFERIIAELTMEISRLEARLKQAKLDFVPLHRRKLQQLQQQQQQQPGAAAADLPKAAAADHPQTTAAAAASLPQAAAAVLPQAAAADPPQRKRTKFVAARLLLPQQPTAAADAASPTPHQPHKFAASDKYDPMGRQGISKKSIVMKNEMYRMNNGEPPHIKLHDFCDPTNIFQLVRPNTPDSMSFESAYTALKLAFTKAAQDKWWRYRDINSMELYCEACKKVVVKVHIFEHFFSVNHMKLVRHACGVISRPALQYWLRQLQLATSVAAVVAVPTATPPAALAAAAAAVDELQRSAAAAAAEPLPLFEKEVKKEVKEEMKEEDMEMEN